MKNSQKVCVVLSDSIQWAVILFYFDAIIFDPRKFLSAKALKLQESTMRHSTKSQLNREGVLRMHFIHLQKIFAMQGKQQQLKIEVRVNCIAGPAFLGSVCSSVFRLPDSAQSKELFSSPSHSVENKYI